MWTDDGVGGADPERLRSARADRPGCRGRRFDRDRKPPAQRHSPAPGAPVRVALADDAVLFREGIARVLSERGLRGRRSGWEPPTSCSRRSRRQEPDVVVVDIRMPPTHTHEGLLAALQIRDSHPEIGVLMLSQYIETHYAMQLLADRPAGAGYLLKDRVSHLSEFTEAVSRVGSQGSVIDPAVVAELLGRRRTEQSGRAVNRA